MSGRKITPIKIWGEKNNPGREVASAAWTGTKAVVTVALVGLALGLGLGAYNSVSSG